VSSGEKRSSEKRAGEPSQQKLDLYVIARIIIVLKEKGTVNRTNLATLTGFAYDKLTKYTDWMSEKKLIASNVDGTVSLTEDGSNSYDELVDWILRYVGRVRFPKL
jgi:predicted transcriptional regulator